MTWGTFATTCVERTSIGGQNSLIFLHSVTLLQIRNGRLSIIDLNQVAGVISLVWSTLDGVKEAELLLLPLGQWRYVASWLSMV